MTERTTKLKDATAIWLILLAGWLLVTQTGESGSYFVSLFAGGELMPFLKNHFQFAANAVWRAVLYLHILNAILCAVVGAILFFFNEKARRFHRLGGMFYAVSIVFIIVPTGFYLTSRAEATAFAAVGLQLTLITMLLATVRGVMLAIRRDIASHRRWMLRSYLLLQTAITFRFINRILIQLNHDHAQAFAASAWLSLIINLLLAEIIWHLWMNKQPVVAAPRRALKTVNA
jgi:uncharacterized membrane protein